MLLAEDVHLEHFAESMGTRLNHQRGGDRAKARWGRAGKSGVYLYNTVREPPGKVEAVTRDHLITALDGGREQTLTAVAIDILR